MEDINTYLFNLDKCLTLKKIDKDKIEISIAYIKQKIWGIFQERLFDVRVFGSYTKETFIQVDNEADVDILVIFKKREFVPETYLKQIKKIAELHYSRSIVYPDHPTIVIELDHIKFEIVPAIFASENEFKIPAPRMTELKWTGTNPSELHQKLHRKDGNNNNLIIPVIRIIKYWNFLKGKPFSSFEIERRVISKLYDCKTIKDYFFVAANSLEEIVKTPQQKSFFEEIKLKRSRLRTLEQNKLIEYIELELTSFIPIP